MSALKGQPAAKPSQLADPVPGQQSAVDAFFADYKPPQVDATAQFEAAAAPAPAEQPGLGSQIQEAGSQALDAAGRALDYGGGLLRTGLASAAGVAQTVAQGKNPLMEKPVVGQEDVVAALKGKAPVFDEYLRRLGVPEGGSIELPGLGRYTIRGAVGLAGDIAASPPLNKVVALASKFPVIKEILGAPGAALEAVGAQMYKAGLKTADAKLALKDKEPISKYLMQAGESGTTAQLAEKVKDMADTMGGVRQGLYDEATKLGAGVDLNTALKRTELLVDKLGKRKSYGAAAIKEEVNKILDHYKGLGSLTIEEASAAKSELFEAIKSSKIGNARTAAKALNAAMAADLREAIVSSSNKAKKGLGDAIEEVNQKWGTLITAQKPMEQQAAKAATKSLISQIDGIILGGGLALPGGIGTVPAAAVVGVKKMFQLANTTYAKTTFGNALINAGKHSLEDSLMKRSLRQILIDAQKKSGQE